MAPRIYDCFCFFMEHDVLELRLRTLAPHVHRFVLVESAFDFAGRPKPLHFHENRAKFAAFEDRITYVASHEAPPNPDARWAWQRFQRDQLLAGLGEAAPDDLVLISDVDEIPSVQALKTAAAKLTHRPGVAIFTMDHHTARLNLKHKIRRIVGTRMVRMRHFKVPHLVRQMKRRYWKSAPGWLDQIPTRFNALKACGAPIPRIAIDDGGWHFNSIGGDAYIEAKYRSFAVDEQFSDADLAAQKSDLDELTKVDLSALPDAVAADPERWKHILA